MGGEPPQNKAGTGLDEAFPWMRGCCSYAEHGASVRSAAACLCARGITALSQKHKSNNVQSQDVWECSVGYLTSDRGLFWV